MRWYGCLVNHFYSLIVICNIASFHPIKTVHLSPLTRIRNKWISSGHLLGFLEMKSLTNLLVNHSTVGQIWGFEKGTREITCCHDCMTIWVGSDGIIQCPPWLCGLPQSPTGLLTTPRLTDSHRSDSYPTPIPCHSAVSLNKGNSSITIFQSSASLHGANDTTRSFSSNDSDLRFVLQVTHFPYTSVFIFGAIII